MSSLLLLTTSLSQQIMNRNASKYHFATPLFAVDPFGGEIGQLHEAMFKAIKEKYKGPEAVEHEPELTTEDLFPCTYEGCGKTRMLALLRSILISMGRDNMFAVMRNLGSSTTNAITIVVFLSQAYRLG